MNDRDELDQLWSSQPRGPETKGEDMLTIAIKKANEFDRKIAVRNATECVAAAIVTVSFGVMATDAPNALMRAGLAVVAASGVWIAFYVLRYGREAKDPAPDQSLRGFEQAVLNKYEHQIRLLKSVKFWYLLPPYVGLLLMSAGLLSERVAKGELGWGDLAGPAIFTGVFAGVWWLNEGYAVRRLRRERAQLLESMDLAEEEDR